MASLIYDSFLDDNAKGNIVWSGAQSFKMMLVTATYAAGKGTHLTRNDVTNEVTGTNYTTGGVAVGFTLAKDGTNHWETVTFASPTTYTNLTVSNIRAGVIYKTTGTASTDLLVCYVDFGANYSPSAQNFQVSFTSPLKWAN